MNEQVRNSVYFKNKRNFEAAIGRFFTVILPEIAGSLASCQAPQKAVDVVISDLMDRVLAERKQGEWEDLS
nr:hypothetical protein [Photobacterium damselae]